MNRKCSICGQELERNVYLCYDCYQEKRYKYARVLAYSREQDFTRIYDYLEGFTATDIVEYLDSLSYTVIIKDYLPYFLVGDLELLPMEDLADAPVLRKGAYGYPKTHVLRKGNEFSDLYVQVGSKHYISSTCFDPYLPSLEFEDVFSRKAPGKCLLCDTQLRSFEHYLCPFHYREYVNKDLYFKLDVKFGEVECLDAQYNHPYTCKDGHKVMSEAEKLIDDYFFDNDIKHVYEPKIRINGNTVTPDFCIYPNGEPVYIEYWGIVDDEEYDTYKQDKLDLYHKSDITLINIYSTPLNDLLESLEKKLSSYVPGQINFEE